MPSLILPTGLAAPARWRDQDRAGLLIAHDQGSVATHATVVPLRNRYRRITAMKTANWGDSYVAVQGGSGGWEIRSWWKAGGATSGSLWNQVLSGAAPIWVTGPRNGGHSWYLDVTRTENNWWQGQLIGVWSDGSVLIGQIEGNNAADDANLVLEHRNGNLWSRSVTGFI